MIINPNITHDSDFEYIEMAMTAIEVQDKMYDFVDAEIICEVQEKEGYFIYFKPTFEELLSIFGEDDISTIVYFSNFVQDKLKENHAYGLLFPRKEMIALHFVMERKFGICSGWRRNLQGKLEGEWIRKCERD